MCIYVYMYIYICKISIKIFIHSIYLTDDIYIPHQGRIFNLISWVSWICELHHQLSMTDGGLEGETKKIDPRDIQKPSLISPEVQSLGPLLQWG